MQENKCIRRSESLQIERSSALLKAFLATRGFMPPLQFLCRKVPIEISTLKKKSHWKRKLHTFYDIEPSISGASAAEGLRFEYLLEKETIKRQGVRLDCLAHFILGDLDST
jgi:hypothetical protein